MTVLSGATLVSDNPDYDGHWLAMLLGVIYEKSEIAPINFDHLIGQEIKRMLRLLDDGTDSPSRWYQERLLLDEGQMLAAHAIDQHIFDKRIRHRALPDATHLWQKWKTVNAAIDHRLRPVTT
jgi:hypothetical protein